MLMNLNTGICNIKSLKQYNQERSILLFLIQRTKYSNASVESYISFLNLFILLYCIFARSSTFPGAYKGVDTLHTWHRIFVVCHVITIVEEKKIIKGKKKSQHKVFKV